MAKKKPTSARPWADPDDAPIQSTRDIARADLYHGDKLVRRGRGRPKLESKKVQVNLRLAPDVVEHFRSTGVGWQTRIGDIVARAAARAKR